LENYKINP